MKAVIDRWHDHESIEEPENQELAEMTEFAMVFAVFPMDECNKRNGIRVALEAAFQLGRTKGRQE